MHKQFLLLFLFCVLGCAATAQGKETAVQGGRSNDGRFEVRMIQDTNREDRGGSDYVIGIYDARSNECFLRFDGVGGIHTYDEARQTSKAWWNESGSFVAVTDSGTRHSTEVYVFRISDSSARRVLLPDYVQNALGQVGRTETGLVCGAEPVLWDGNQLHLALTFDVMRSAGEPRAIYTNEVILAFDATDAARLVQVTKPKPIEMQRLEASVVDRPHFDDVKLTAHFSKPHIFPDDAPVVITLTNVSTNRVPISFFNPYTDFEICVYDAMGHPCRLTPRGQQALRGDMPGFTAPANDVLKKIKIEAGSCVSGCLYPSSEARGWRDAEGEAKVASHRWNIALDLCYELEPGHYQLQVTYVKETTLRGLKAEPVDFVVEARPQTNSTAAKPFAILVPTRLKVQRAGGVLDIRDDKTSLEQTNLMVRPGTHVGMWCDLYVYESGKPRPTNHCHIIDAAVDPDIWEGGPPILVSSRYGWRPDDEGIAVRATPALSWWEKKEGRVVADKRYSVEQTLTIFETDVNSGRKDWDPQSGKHYRVLLERRLTGEFPPRRVEESPHDKE